MKEKKNDNKRKLKSSNNRNFDKNNAQRKESRKKLKKGDKWHT